MLSDLPNEILVHITGCLPATRSYHSISKQFKELGQLVFVPSREKIFQYVDKKRVDVLERILLRGKLPPLTEDDLNYLLNRISQFGNLDLINKLLSLGANPLAQVNYFSNSLIQALEHNNLVIFDRLFEYQIVPEEILNSILITASRFYHRSIVDHLLTLGANVQYALRDCINFGDIDIAEYLSTKINKQQVTAEDLDDLLNCASRADYAVNAQFPATQTIQEHLDRLYPTENYEGAGEEETRDLIEMLDKITEKIDKQHSELARILLYEKFFAIIKENMWLLYVDIPDLPSVDDMLNFAEVQMEIGRHYGDREWANVIKYYDEIINSRIGSNRSKRGMEVEEEGEGGESGGEEGVESERLPARSRFIVSRKRQRRRIPASYGEMEMEMEIE